MVALLNHGGPSPRCPDFVSPAPRGNAAWGLTPELSRPAATMLRMRSHWSSGKPAEAVELRSGFGLNELLAPWRAQR